MDTSDSLSRHALDVTRHSTGLFRADPPPGFSDFSTFSAVTLEGSEVTLFSYGAGEILPTEAGFFGEAGTVATKETNCSRSGSLCDRGQGFVIAGLSARIGRVCCYRRSGVLGTGWRSGYSYPQCLDAHDIRIREAVAEAVSVELHYEKEMLRYTLGSILSRPLMNSIYGPQVWLDGTEDPAQHDSDAASEAFPQPAVKEDENKAFLPLRLAAISGGAPADKVTVKLVLGDRLTFESCSDPFPLGVAVPVRVWLFGYTVPMPGPCKLFEAAKAYAAGIDWVDPLEHE